VVRDLIVHLEKIVPAHGKVLDNSKLNIIHYVMMFTDKEPHSSRSFILDLDEADRTDRSQIV